MGREQLKFQDMETNVLFDTIGNRTGTPSLNPIGITSRLSFTNVTSLGIQMAGVPPAFDLPLLDIGNADGLQSLSVGARFSSSTQWTGERTRAPGMVPLAVGNSKIYCARPDFSPLIQILNELTGASITAALNPGVGTIFALYGSKTGLHVVIAGTSGLAILDTLTDLVTIFPGTAASSWVSPYITENDAFVIAYNTTTNAVEYFTSAGALIAAYPNPGGITGTASSTHLLATNNAGTMAWFVYNFGTSQVVTRFNPNTGGVFGSSTLGSTSNLPYIEELYSESLDRLVVRWDNGFQLDLLTASTLGPVNNKTNFPRFVIAGPIQSSMVLSYDGNSIFTISDTFFDSGIRQVVIAGTPTPFAGGALATVNILGSPSDRINNPNTQSTIKGFIPSFLGDRVFLAPYSTTGQIYSAGNVRNTVKLNTISPLNGGTLYLEGSVAIPPLRTFYADMIAPSGGSSETSVPATYPFGAVRVARLAPKSLVGNITVGDGSPIVTEIFQVLADVEFYGTQDVYGPDFNFNSGNVGFFNTFTEFSGAQLEINSPTDVNGAMTFQGSTQIVDGVPFSFINGASLLSDATSFIAWAGDASFSGPNPIESATGFTGATSYALFPLGIGINGSFAGSNITTVAPETDLIINAASLNITSSSNIKTTLDLECTTPSSFAGGAPGDQGLVLKDNAGIRWRVTVSTLGALRVFLA